MLARSVLTRSDLGGAIIDGADFSDAVLDLTTKQVMHKFCIKGSAAVGATGLAQRLGWSSFSSTLHS